MLFKTSQNLWNRPPKMLKQDFHQLTVQTYHQKPEKLYNSLTVITVVFGNRESGDMMLILAPPGIGPGEFLFTGPALVWLNSSWVLLPVRREHLPPLTWVLSNVLTTEASASIAEFAGFNSPSDTTPAAEISARGPVEKASGVVLA
jgi:hypothetical protein